MHASAPSSFERQFRNELPLLYKYLQEAPTGKVCNQLLLALWFLCSCNAMHFTELKLAFLVYPDKSLLVH